jgi:hypothetical protein
MADSSYIPEPKRSFVQKLTRLLPYWFTVARFVWSIVIAQLWMSTKGYEFFLTQIVDPVRGVFSSTKKF